MRRKPSLRKAGVKKRRSVRGRPPAREVASRAERLLDVATEVFLEKGYKGASMIEIARRAGASKQTLYARYASKAELFAALIERKAALLFEAIGPLEGRSPRDTLIRCGANLLELIVSTEARGVHRVVVAECMEFPELGEIFWSRGPGRVRAMLADYIREQQKVGRLPRPDSRLRDPEQAVEVLLALMVSEMSLRAWIGLDSPRKKTAAERRAWVELAVDLFLAAMKGGA
jgi:TetR/AcrR family transcriptional regulator, mexJK operon transcriptional repressor